MRSHLKPYFFSAALLLSAGGRAMAHDVGTEPTGTDSAPGFYSSDGATATATPSSGGDDAYQHHDVAEMGTGSGAPAPMAAPHAQRPTPRAAQDSSEAFMHDRWLQEIWRAGP